MKKKLFTLVVLLIGWPTYTSLRQDSILLPDANHLEVRDRQGHLIKKITEPLLAESISELTQIKPYLFKNPSNQDYPVGVEDYYTLDFVTADNTNTAFLYQVSNRTYLMFPYELTVELKNDKIWHFLD